MLSIFSYVSGTSVCLPWRRKCLFKSFAHFLIGLLSGVKLCEFFIYFGDQTLVRVFIGKYIFPYGWFLFILMLFSLAVQKLFILMRSHVFILPFMSLALGDISVKILLHWISGIFLPMFSSRTFMVSWLIFKSFIHHSLNFEEFLSLRSSKTSTGLKNVILYKYTCITNYCFL